MLRKQKSNVPNRILLNKAIEEYIAYPQEWKWGSNDCCMFYANMFKTVTGRDPAKIFRGKYRSELGAAKFIKNYGSVEKLVSGIFGPPVRPCQRFATILAPVIAEFEGSYCVGICAGWRAVFLTRNGTLFKLPLEQCEATWRLGKWA